MSFRMAPEIRIEIEMLVSEFEINEAELRRFLQEPIIADLARRAIRVESMAKRLASNASPSQPGEGPGVVTGRLRGSITWRPGADALSPFVDIGTNVTYAPFLEGGTSRMAARPFLKPALEAARST